MWIYAIDTNIPGTPQELPSVWKDPVSGVTYTNFRELDNSTLNSLHWYIVQVVNPVLSQYEERIGYTITFDTDHFVQTWNKSDVTLAMAKEIKLNKLEEDREALQMILFADITKFHDNIVKALALLASGKTANNNTFLGNLVTQVTTYNANNTTIDNRVAAVNAATTIAQVIAA